MVREIREWLEKGGPYAAGVALYETHGKSRVVLRSLQYGETEFTRATLRRELARLAGAESVRAVDTSAERVHKTPERVQQVPPPERPTWFATRAYAHAQLELVATDAQRRQLCVAILEASENITASYQAAPEALVEASLPMPVSEPGEARRQLANLRCQASKLKKNPARAGDLVRVKEQITLLEHVLKKPCDGEPQLHPRH